MIALLFASVVGVVPPSPAFSSAFLCPVARVRDADTWVCEDGTAVRAWGWSAPEKREPGGAEATEALKGLIVGRVLACEPKGLSFDRVVARCHLLGPDFGHEMIRKGFARPEPRYGGATYASPNVEEQ